MANIRLRTSLIQRLSLDIWALFVALLLLLAGLGYLGMRMAFDWFVPASAQRTARLHAAASEGLFEQAEHSVDRLQRELLLRLDEAERNERSASLARFDELFVRGTDGLWRLRPDRVDTQRAPTLYLHEPATGLDDSARLRAVTSYDLLREQGPALVPPFFSAYMDFVEDGLMVYARGLDWGNTADASATNAAYPTMQGSDPRRNPQRRIFWTPVYLDQQAKTWMVSVIKPLDWQGRWVGTVGHDVSIQTLIEQASAGSDINIGTFLVMSADGDLIAHPQLRERIAAADGQLKLSTLRDPLFSELHRMIAGRDSGAGRSRDGKLWVAWSKIHGPGWYEIYLVPQSRLDGMFLRGLAGMFILGIVALLPALWVLRVRVRKLVATPLQKLTRAVDSFGQGRQPEPVGIEGEDELARLGGAFDTMVAELVRQHSVQAAQEEELRAEMEARSHLLTGLEEERARLLALLGAMNLGILFVGNDERVIYCNAAFLAMWGLADEATLTGRAVGEGMAGAQMLLSATGANAPWTAHASGDGEHPQQQELLLRDGRTLLHTSHPVRDTQGRPIGWLWIHEDVTRARRTAEQLVHLAEHDTLTGLCNRHRFENDLARLLHDGAADDRTAQVSLLLFDLDEFKYVNDSFGHRAGDEVLNRVATESRALVRSSDTLFRLGGDEFAVLMPGAGLDEAQHLAEMIVRRISQTPIVLNGRTMRLTTSLGIAHFPSHADNPEDLNAHADTAMYQAKRNGKGRWSVYRPDIDSGRLMIERLTWNDRIARALEHDLLALHFQGVYDARDGALSHLEALIRMKDETHPGQWIMPLQFIGHAEKSGKILEIDRWVVHQGIALLARHPQLPGLAINLSGRSLDEPDLPMWIDGLLREHGVAPQRLLVELTETSAVSDIGDAAHFIAALRKSGCKTCLDDFGTGFSSFAYLRSLDADVLKIDGSFIRNLPQERGNQAFVRAIIEVARGMGKLTVAEFVEDGATLVMLRAMGVDMLQGYYLDKPTLDHPALHAPMHAQEPQAGH